MRFCLKSLFVAAILSAGACARSDAVDSVDSTTVTASHRAHFERRLVLTGELRAVEATEIKVPRTPMWSIAINWLIDDGAEVAAGEKILEFDNAAFVDSLDEQRIALDRARRALDLEQARAEAALTQAWLRLERARIGLAKAELEATVPEKLISKKVFKDNEIALKRAATENAKALEDLRAAEAVGDTEVKVKEIELAALVRQITTAEKAIEDLVVHAPEDGVVVVDEHPSEGRKFKVGDQPWVGLTVLRLPKLGRMNVKARLYDVDDGLVDVGAEVMCTLDTFPDLRFAGVVRDVTSIAQEVGRYSLRRAFDVTVDLERSDPNRMRPGMSMKVEVPIGQEGAPLLVPRWAVDHDDGGARVRLADGAWRTVELGLCSAQVCIVEDGLEEGVALMPAWGPAG